MRGIIICFYRRIIKRKDHLWRYGRRTKAERMNGDKKIKFCETCKKVVRYQ